MDNFLERRYNYRADQVTEEQMLPGVQRYRNLQRLREIIHVLIQHGFQEIVDQMELVPYLSIPARILGMGRKEEERLSTPERFRVVLEELGPTFIKLGQILSTRPDVLPPKYIEELSKLQDSAPPIPFSDVERVIEEELGWPPETFFKELDPNPIASASLAQVHGAVLHNGVEVVVKVQRPGIGEIIERDLNVLFDLARLAQERTAWGELYDFVDIADDFAHKMRAELDYRKEGFNADKFRKNFVNEPHLYIPKVYWEYTTKRVITIERIRGIKIDDVDAMVEAGIDPKNIAHHSARIIIKEVFIDGFFHADPHPGNFFVMPGEVIGAMDFGLVGHLDQYVREDLAHLLVASVNLDPEGIVDRLIKMGAAGRRINRAALRRDINRLLENYASRPLKEIRAKEVVSEIMPIAFKHRLRLPSDLWLLGKTFGMMEGVGLKLDPDFDMFEVARPYAHQVIWQFTSPQALGRRTLKGLEEWGELAMGLPRKLDSILSLL
jgi:ubiquinone biosynthesis protein